MMDGNQSVIMRNSIPVNLQGRVFACRNTLQFFTIPIGLGLGGFMVDYICEPFMAANTSNPLLKKLFGNEQGAGAALMLFALGIAGIILCLAFGRRLKQYKYIEE